MAGVSATTVRVGSSPLAREDVMKAVIVRLVATTNVVIASAATQLNGRVLSRLEGLNFDAIRIEGLSRL